MKDLTNKQERMLKRFKKAMKDYDVTLEIEQTKNGYILDYTIGINYIQNSIQVCDEIYSETFKAMLSYEIEMVKDTIENAQFYDLEEHDIETNKKLLKWLEKELKIHLGK